MDSNILNDWFADPMLNGTSTGTTPAVGTVDASSSSMLKSIGVAMGNHSSSPKSNPTITTQDAASELNSLGRKVPFDIQTIVIFILQHCFRVNDEEIAAKFTISDIILDQTYPQALTLRTLRADSSYYRYFSTVTREREILSCPIFYLSVYFYLMWDELCDQDMKSADLCKVPLLKKNASYQLDSKSLFYKSNLQSHLKYTDIARTTVVLPDSLRRTVYPWLAQLKEDIDKSNATHYRLYSILELFEYLEECLIQDMAYLECTSQLPQVQDLIRRNNTNLFGSTAYLTYRSQLQSRFIGGEDKDALYNSLLEKMEEKFMHIGNKVSQHNLRLNQEIISLKNELNNMNSMIYQVLQFQRQLLKGPTSPFLPVPPNIDHRPMSSSDLSGNDGKMNALSPKSATTNSGVATGQATALLDRNLINSLTSNEHNVPLAPLNSLPLLPHGNFGGHKKNSLPKRTESRENSTGKFKRFKYDNKAPESLASASNSIGSPLESLMPRTVTSPRIPVSSLTTSVAQQVKPGNICTTDQLPQLSRLLHEPKASVNSPANNSALAAQIHQSDIDGIENPKDSEIGDTRSSTCNTKESNTGSKSGNSDSIKYKLSRENKTVWDLYTEWYTGLNGKPSIKSLIEKYGWRRWKVSEDSHFFPTRRIIMNYIEKECDRGTTLGRYPYDMDRKEVRKMVVKDLENFRVNNGLSLNSISLYFRNLTRENREICIYDNFADWSLLVLPEEEKNVYCKRKHGSL
ncbi:HDR063Cp [Eremothecium sinecaudum]|uniref:HDR063Cp n=1 Tax=Eremothecium sinecaudum TaxID=45286 RepID=A0A109UZ35_9SACH|nr:HDR063Cp [Eremothecium sinecaudum]AMD20805.1 HDR063Cp [Eremothecium sinecaudum]